MKVQGSSAFVTGANRGLGQALVQALLERGAARVYAGARHIHKIPVFDGGDGGRVVPVPFDLTMPESILAASARAADVDLLINNASTAAFGGPLEVDRASIAQEMHVNYLGTYDTIRAFLPALRSNRGAIVNVLSLLALSSTPPMAGYSSSKAALHSMTQALRPVLAADGIAVHGVYPAGIDTDMLAGLDVPKAAPSVVADGILDGLEQGEEDIFPDPVSRSMADIWWSDPKAFERAFSHV